MSNQRLNFIMRMVLVMFYVLLALTLVAVFFVLGPRAEALMDPVVRGFKVVSIEAGPESTIIDGVLEKLRGECQIVEVSILASGRVGESGKAVRMEFEEGVVRSRGEGGQYWGPWTIYPPSQPIGPVITISSLHSCHALWQVRSVMWTGLASDIFPYHYRSE